MTACRLLALVLALALGLGVPCAWAQAASNPTMTKMPCHDANDGMLPDDGQAGASASCVLSCFVAVHEPSHRLRIGSVSNPAPSSLPVPASFAKDPSDPPPRSRPT